MKRLPDPYSYGDYRSYIKDALGAVGLTYQRFCQRNIKEVSFSALGQMLSNRSYRMGLEAFHRILKALKINRRDATHLMLLRIENDLQAGEKGASDVRAIFRGLIELNRIYGGSRDISMISPGSMQVAEVFEILPDYLQARVLDEIISVFHVFKARHPRRTTINHALTSLNALRSGKTGG